jgi:hypothetical protein
MSYFALRRLPRRDIIVRLSDPAVVAEFFCRCYDTLEELLTRYGRLGAEPEQEALRGDEQHVTTQSLPTLQQTVLSRLKTYLENVPDGTFLAISYEGKVLAKADSVRQLSIVLQESKIPASQIFIHLKGSPAAFRWA